MNRTEFLKKVDELLETPEGTLKGPERLEDIENWNSMAIVEFVALADESFNVNVSPRSFANCETIDDVLDLVKPLRGEPANA